MANSASVNEQNDQVLNYLGSLSLSLFLRSALTTLNEIGASPKPIPFGCKLLVRTTDEGCVASHLCFDEAIATAPATEGEEGTEET